MSGFSIFFGFRRGDRLIFLDFILVVTRGCAVEPGMYSWRYILKKRTNSESNNGPKITPQKPNIGIPIKTPKMVISGWISASTFCSRKRAILSTPPMTTNPYAAIPTLLRHHPSGAGSGQSEPRQWLFPVSG